MVYAPNIYYILSKSAGGIIECAINASLRSSGYINMFSSYNIALTILLA